MSASEQSPPDYKTRLRSLAAGAGSALPDHHRRYAVAWTIYRDRGLPEDARLILECEMDSAQNEFRFDEWEAFRETLPGFLQFWEGWRRDLLSPQNDNLRGGSGSGQPSKPTTESNHER